MYASAAIYSLQDAIQRALAKSMSQDPHSMLRCGVCDTYSQCPSYGIGCLVVFYSAIWVPQVISEFSPGLCV